MFSLIDERYRKMHMAFHTSWLKSCSGRVRFVIKWDISQLLKFRSFDILATTQRPTR